ncbi:GNAT family N-acetyltransferase [Paenibacillus dakarensis]|uniref:GNAT family N-acetyltransferase n=1 Tax=Paenibacillus dakarensis TaxID=1527293 RepID=UPI0006D57D2F|nr:GNAT family N-acetyltransferase [Paenibacillus dakarensis]
MIIIREMDAQEGKKISEIDRSEFIHHIYVDKQGELQKIDNPHECPTWDGESMEYLIKRFTAELEQGGKGFGAFDGERLVGFGVLGHRERGLLKDHLQVDLMYVSRNYRRQGIGTLLMKELSEEARDRGASYLYISSTETESAVSFYTSNGGLLTEDKDPDLFELEPKDIHMVIKL